jgi:hypothetical protein
LQGADEIAAAEEQDAFFLMLTEGARIEEPTDAPPMISHMSRARSNEPEQLRSRRVVLWRPLST